MSMFRYVNVGCDRCGAPASDPCPDAKEARKHVPRGWRRVNEGGKWIDLCPECAP